MIGNARFADLYRVEDTGSALAIYSALTGTTLATVRATHKVHTFLMAEKAAIQPQADGTMKCTLTQYEDTDALNAVLNAMAKPKAASAVRKERYRIDGTKDGGASSTSYGLLIFVGGSDVTDGCKVTAIFGKLAATSGSENVQYNEWADPTIEFEGSLAPYDLTIAAGLFDATIISATDVATKIPKISKGECFVREFVALAA